MKRILALFIASAISIGASAATLLGVGQLNPIASTAGQAIVSTGVSTQPAWGGIGVNGIAAIAANTVLANATASSASPTAITVTGCNGAAQALQWTNGSGFGCNSAIATSGANANITSLNSPALGAATATTQSAGTSNTTVATTNYVTSQIASGTQGGAFTTLSATGLITPSTTVGIKGTATNDNAQAGSWGEYQTYSTSATAATTGTVLNAATTSSPLAAGDYDVECTAAYAPAGTTVIQSVSIGASTTSASFGGLGTTTSMATGAAAGFSQTIPSPVSRISLSTATTVYCPALANFTVSTLTIAGFMRVRRVR